MSENHLEFKQAKMSANHLDRIHQQLDRLTEESVQMQIFRQKALTIMEGNTKILQEHEQRSRYNEKQLELLKRDLAKWRGILIGIGTIWTLILSAAHLALRLWPPV